MCKFLFKLTLIVVLLVCSNTVVFGWNPCEAGGPSSGHQCDRNPNSITNAVHEWFTYNAKFTGIGLYCYETGEIEQFTIRNLNVYNSWWPWAVPVPECSFGDDQTPIELYYNPVCLYGSFWIYFDQGDTCAGERMRIGRLCTRGVIILSSQYSGCNSWWYGVINNSSNQADLIYYPPLICPSGTLLQHMLDGYICCQ